MVTLEKRTLSKDKRRNKLRRFYFFAAIPEHTLREINLVLGRLRYYDCEINS